MVVRVDGETGPERLGEVFPGRVAEFDESDLLDTSPMFEFFLACNGYAHVLEVFVVDQTVDIVASSVGSGASFAMSADSLIQAVGDSDVEGTRAA